jgi:hypothetical protein
LACALAAALRLPTSPAAALTRRVRRAISSCRRARAGSC